MKYLLPLMTVVIALSCTSVKPVIFQTTKVNYEKKHFKSLLAIGLGDLPTRLFLDNLATRLDAKLAAKNIQLTYQFVGTGDEKSGQQVRAMADAGKFDGVLFFNATGATRTNLIYTENYGVNTMPYTSVTTVSGAAAAPVTNSATGMINNQGFNLQLYDMKNNSGTIWEASLGLHFDFSSKANYSAVADKIIESFVANKLCD